ncbi:MAG: response regulator [Candidatus Polarisedimenticolaceae bacterium]|nr:response regulator [Candidatus Polarisedimenticolaceae bacterium]
MSQDRTQSPSAIQLLLVDDEEAVLRSLKRLFRATGYDIYTTTSGEDALKLLAQRPIDIIISDMRMPGMSGAEFLAHAAKEWPDTIRMVLTGYADLNKTISAINSGHIYRYFSKPWDEEDMRLSLHRAAEQVRLQSENRRLQSLTVQQNNELKSLNAELEVRVVARTSELEQTAAMLDSAYDELKDNYRHTVELLAHLTDLRYSATRGHGRRVAELAKLLAQKLDLDLHTIDNIRSAGFLHDIGKMVLPDELIKVPLSTLSDKDQQRVAKHPRLGEAALMGLPPLKDVAALIRAHHERFDGSGYPDGLVGDAIPLGARILAVAEDFDELCVGTLTKHAHSSDEAIDYLRKRSGSRYDPSVIEACIALKSELSKTREESGSALLCITTQDAEPGMVLVSNLVSSDGMLLLTTGYELNEAVIEKIKRMEHEDGSGYTLQVRLESGE